jgi:tRNA(Leu) C34 or U34 (ribose-2'-O)-methylase TrmL
MKRLNRYTKERFASLPPAAQHKKCIELLNCIGINEPRENLQTMYQDLCVWLRLEEIDVSNIEQLEKRLYLHHSLAGMPFGETALLPFVRTLDRTDAVPFLQIHTYLDGLRSCHNVGSIIRTAEAFRLGPVHLSCDMMPPNHPQSRKTSMGAWEHVSVSVIDSPESLPHPLIALETVDNAIDFHELTYPNSCTLLLGNEVLGINQNLLKKADYIVTIPLKGRKNSLNVANAFAIVAAQISCQLKGKNHRA